MSNVSANVQASSFIFVRFIQLLRNASKGEGGHLDFARYCLIYMLRRGRGTQKRNGCMTPNGQGTTRSCCGSVS